MPFPKYECDNFNHCHRYVETPGLCANCKQEAKKLESKMQNETRILDIQIKHGRKK